MKRLKHSLLGGFLVTLCSILIPVFAWPIVLFDRVFPANCVSDVPIICISGSAIIATVISEFTIYSLLTYVILRWHLVYLKPVSYIGNV
jgi:hypothetical protein